MKTAAIILLIGVAYAVVGYVCSICLKAWDNAFYENNDLSVMCALWIVFLPLLICYLIVTFIGKRLAVIPVMIIALIKAKKED